MTDYMRSEVLKPREGFGRRTFLSASTASLAGLIIVGCGDDDGDDAAATQTTQQQGEAVTIDFSKGDVAVINFAYALEQLEAAFYKTVNDSPASGLNKDARNTLEDIGAHEIAHREFFKAKLGDMAIPALEVDFGAVDFDDADSVLQTARTFEDLGVGAYNGAAKFLSVGGPLKLMPLKAAAEIVSVEARHASAIRTLIGGNSTKEFAPMAFGEALAPSAVLKAADPFIKTNIRLENLPSGA